LWSSEICSTCSTHAERQHLPGTVMKQLQVTSPERPV
jgi:hypothetical protein